jgi:hypothetical protein
VAVSKGGFSVLLGSATPLNSLAFDEQYYLGITVGAGPELAPRVRLASSPYGMSLRLPFAGSESNPGSLLSLRNTGGGTAITADPRLDVGSQTSDGSLNWYLNGSYYPVGKLGSDPGAGGKWELYDLYGTLHSSAYTSAPGTGGFYMLGNGSYYNGIGMSGSYYSPGNPGLTLLGSTNSIQFITGAVGDASVQLPYDAINSSEIMDEPGLASNHALVVKNITSTNATVLTDIQSVTITIPSYGYIVVHAEAEISASAGAQFTYQISQTSAGALEYGYYHFYGGSTSTFTSYSALSNQRIYYKAPGSYTFYFQAYLTGAPSSGAVAYWPTVTAEYFPTNYGVVTAVVSGQEAASFRHRTPVAASAMQERSGSGTSYEVDLSELEATEAAQRAALAQTQLELAKAKFAAAVRAGRAAPAKKP